ncbi:MAG: 30S ribosomal protein S4 [Candidatus Gracilibacteria bacterium]|jgi:small subunit ribosomal protein S4
MSRYRGPKTRLSRRLGAPLFNGESKLKAYNKKNYKPGQHGQKHFSQLSEYGKHLFEKQKARFLYGINERQSQKYYNLATKSTQVTGIRYLQLLEQRLDNVIFRAGFANTRPQARQFVSHGLVKLNGKRVKTPSIQVKPGDTFEIREKTKSSKIFEAVKAGKKPRTPKWISADGKELKGQIISAPDKDDMEQFIDHQMITEYYSK